MDSGLQTIKLSELPEATTLNESDYSLIVQNGTSKKIKGLLLKGNAGDNGKSIEIQKTDTHIQWRQEGGQWINLVALADLKGDKGEQGEGANVDLTDYATKVWVTQQLASYYTKAEIDLSLSNKANISHAHTEYASIDHAHNYNDLTNKPTIPSKTSDLTNDSGFLTSIPSEYVTEEEMSTVLSTKANKSDIPSLDGYATENFVTTKISEAQLSGGEVDLSTYATKTYTDNAISTALDGHTFKFLTQAEYDALETKNPLVEYHITDITDTGEGITTEQAQRLQIAYEHSQSVHVQASDIPTKTSDLQNDSGFITSIPEEYITETELSAKGYLTSHQDISGLQTKTDNSLTTTSKEIVGAINSINEQLDTIANNGTTVADGSITLRKLNCNVVGTSYYANISSDYAAFKITNTKIVGQTFRVKFKMELLQAHNGQYLRVYTGSPSGTKELKITTPKLNTVQEYDVTLKYDTSVTLNSINIGAMGGKTVFNAYIRDIEVYVDDVLYTDLYKLECNSELLVKDSFILADKDYVDEEINKLNVPNKLDKSELINKVAKGYRVNVRQTSYGKGISFKFDGGDDVKYVADDKITVNFRCRYQSLSQGGLELYTTSNNALFNFGDFRTDNTIGYLRLYNASVTATNTGYINDLRFYVYANLDFEIQDIYVKINDKVYYPKSLVYPETTIVEETPLVLDDNSIATKSFVEDLIGGIHKQDFELPFVNNIYTVKSSKNFFGVPIFLDYLYGKFKGTDRIIFDTDNDRQYVYPLRSLNKLMVNTKVDYKVKSETLNVPNVKFNHICIDENLNTDNIRLLIIGDSVTAGAITKQQYWSVCAEYFAKEDIIKNRDSKFMCLGSNNFRTTTVEFNGKTKTVTAGACGISSWSLNNWLTNVSNTTNYDNPGGLNGFTYVDNGVTKFSILKWIERFRNYDDDGNKLELGNGTGTWINANNINKVKCCTPNVIYINSTHNGGTIEQHEEIINIIKQELPNCKVIVGNPMPLLGSYYPDKYVDEWIDDSLLRQLPNYGGEGNYLSTRLNSLKYYVKKEKEDTTNSFYFMPQVVITPTIEGYEYDLVDNGFKQMKKITTQSLPKEHPGTLTHKIWGYELYALLKYISGIEQGATNNFDTVPLYEITQNEQVR